MVNKKALHVWLVFLLLIAPLLSLPPQQAEAADSTENSLFSWDNATVYFVMTDRFYDGDPSNNNSYGRATVDATGKKIGTFHGGDIKGLTAKLQEGYFADLGVNVIWITAPYEQIHGWVGGGDSGDFSHYAYHGYYPLDYTMMDRNMGTVEEMREFVDLAHSHGIRIVMDVVMNHAGYNTLKDMEQYGFGAMNGITSSWTPGSGQNWHSHHNYIDYTNAGAWAKWWGSWVRTGISGYTACGGDEKTQCLSNLPDFRTDLTSSVGLPPVLAAKWAQETSGYSPWIVPAAASLRQDLNIAPADYIAKWLSAWVREFGIDGFRVDTAKHVELSRWALLKREANAALQQWRQNNPSKPGASWTDDFWMTAEVWGHGVGKSEYFSNGFDSVINFAFQNANFDSLESIYSQYAGALNTDPDFNVLSYISSHDTKLYDRSSLLKAGTALLLAPGGVQIFYGDETARPFGETGSDSTQGTRSFMNWGRINADVLSHWQKLGQFRNNHIAVGAGSHALISSSPYTFSRSYAGSDAEDNVVIVTGASGTVAVDVSSVFDDGSTVRDAYTGNTVVVDNGKAAFTAHANGIILIELVSVSGKPSVSASPAGGAFKTDTQTVTLSVERADSGKYTLDGSDPRNGTSFSSGDVITIGGDMAFNETRMLKLYAENEYGSVSREYVFTKKDPNPAIQIRFKKPSDWSAPQLYYYETSPAISQPTWATSPAMTPEGGDWYVYSLVGVDSARIIFKDSSGHQIPGANQAGLQVAGDVWYSERLYDYNPETPDTSAPSAPEGLVQTSVSADSVSLEWAAATDNIEVAGYTIYRDGSKIGTASGTSYTASGLSASTTYQFTVEAYDAAGNVSAPSDSISVTTEEGNTAIIYYKRGYATPYIHYKPDGGNWTTAPGIAMTEDTEYAGYSKITIPLGTAGGLTAAFNDGKGTWDNNRGANYVFEAGSSTFVSGTITPGTPQPDSLTLTVTVPGGTTGDLYLASSLNEWNAGDANYKLAANSDGTYSIKLEVAAGTTFQYKLTRGSWETVEVNGSGGDISNRSVTTAGGAQRISITVERWKS